MMEWLDWLKQGKASGLERCKGYAAGDMDPPVVFVVFNRPESTARVFAAIRRRRPSRLLVIADGPRPGRLDERATCEQVRRIALSVDWPCRVETNFSEVNLGCRVRVSSGLDWVFQRCSAAIIIEDDCLPHDDFFSFCDQLLERYAFDERIGLISGTNFQGRRHPEDASYYMSRYVHIWGWATWARSWQAYRLDMSAWPSLRATGWLAGELQSVQEVTWWRTAFDQAYAGTIDTWDIQWVFACWRTRMLGVQPAVNLISNIGFGPGATHTTSDSHGLAGMSTEALGSPLIHPEHCLVDHDADACVRRLFFTRPDVARRVLARLKRAWRQCS